MGLSWVVTIPSSIFYNIVPDIIYSNTTAMNIECPQVGMQMVMQLGQRDRMQTFQRQKILLDDQFTKKQLKNQKVLDTDYMSVCTYFSPSSCLDQFDL